MNSPKTRTFIAVVIFVLGVSLAQAATDSFPMPDIIAPNVAFWVKVYTHYSTNQGIVHDSEDLNIIYDVIDLLPYEQSGSAKINRRRIKAAANKYERILRQLAENPEATNEECRCVAQLFDQPRLASRFRLAAARVRCQIGQKDRFRAGLVRSGAFIDRIREIFKQKGLPDDLAYLPHVESSFNPNAYSKFGAAGVWQFTRSTGKRFLDVGYAVDERRDPILATYAAADFLSDNYAKLGAWALAITAYNHGASGMQRAQSLHGDFEEVFKSYQSRTFKFASRNFYSEFLAARKVASNYQAYFGDLSLDRPIPSRTVVLQGYIAVNDLSRHFGIDASTIKQLNPAVRQPVFDGEKLIPKGYRLRLPMLPDTKEDSLVASVLATIYKNAQKPSNFYTVQQGDTAGKIARSHGVQLSDLILANNLDRQATVYPHQTLRIPLSRERSVKPAKPAPPAGEPTLVARIEAPASKEASGPVFKAKTEPAAPDQAPSAPQAAIVPVLIAKNEPAAQKATPAVNMNGKATALQARNEQIVTADVRFESVTRINGRLVGIIRVEVEETLGHYADWANVRTRQVRKLNKLKFGRVLQPNRKIKIPLNRTTAAEFEQTRYEYHKRLQEDFFAVYRIGELKAYGVKRGDSCWTLCQDKFKIPMWLLKHCNPEVDLAALNINQQLLIPTIEKASPDDAGAESDSDSEPQGETTAQDGGGN